MAIINFDREFENTTAQMRLLLTAKYSADPDDLAEQAYINHSLELCTYRLKRFACEKTLDAQELSRLRLIETVFPEIYLRVPVEFQRHTFCPCITARERAENEAKRAALEALIVEEAPPTFQPEALMEVLQVRRPFEEDTTLTDADLGLEYDPSLGFHVAVDVDPILHDGERDDLGDTIEHRHLRGELNPPIDENLYDTIAHDIVKDNYGKSDIKERSRKTTLRRRFRGRVDPTSKRLTIVRRDRTTLCTLDMPAYGFPLSGPDITRLPLVGAIEVREIMKIVNWWNRNYHKPPDTSSRADLATRAFTSLPLPCITDLCKLMI